MITKVQTALSWRVRQRFRPAEREEQDQGVADDPDRTEPNSG